MAKTKKDAHQQAAENALRSLAGKNYHYFSFFLNCGSVNHLIKSRDCSYKSILVCVAFLQKNMLLMSPLLLEKQREVPKMKMGFCGITVKL